MEIEQIQDVDLEQLKKDVEADENIVSFALFYDRRAKKMYFIKHGDEGIIDKMVNKAAYSITAFANTISKIAWRWNKSQSSSNPLDNFGFDPFNSIFGKYRK